jgi:hypothetical protein
LSEPTLTIQIWVVLKDRAMLSCSHVLARLIVLIHLYARGSPTSGSQSVILLVYGRS